jgi:hypothetical protein
MKHENRMQPTRVVRLRVLFVLLAALFLSACEVYFSQTGHYMQPPFLDAWGKFGGVEGCGYPLTEEFLESSRLDNETRIVQYTERCLFEMHPENEGTDFEVLGAHLGTYKYRDRYGGLGALGQTANKTPGQSVFFRETNRWLGGRFLNYWRAQGGLEVFGYPITDELTEVSQLNGRRYLVQYFERAVFEYHPENAGTQYEVLLAQLGKYELDRRYPRGGSDNPAIARQPSPTVTSP